MYNRGFAAAQPTFFQSLIIKLGAVKKLHNAKLALFYALAVLHRW